MKAVLVIDKPAKCEECPLYVDAIMSGWCVLKCADIVYCPLKPMLKKQELKKGRMTDGEEILEAYINGYNACIEELEEIGEENVDS